MHYDTWYLCGMNVMLWCYLILISWHVFLMEYITPVGLVLDLVFQISHANWGWLPGWLAGYSRQNRTQDNPLPLSCTFHPTQNHPPPNWRPPPPSSPPSPPPPPSLPSSPWKKAGWLSPKAKVCFLGPGRLGASSSYQSQQSDCAGRGPVRVPAFFPSQVLSLHSWPPPPSPVFPPAASSLPPPCHPPSLFFSEGAKKTTVIRASCLCVYALSRKHTETTRGHWSRPQLLLYPLSTLFPPTTLLFLPPLHTPTSWGILIGNPESQTPVCHLKTFSEKAKSA